MFLDKGLFLFVLLPYVFNLKLEDIKKKTYEIRFWTYCSSNKVSFILFFVLHRITKVTKDQKEVQNLK